MSRVDRRRIDLTAVIALALLALFVSLLPVGAALRAPLLLPAVLVLPGYALGATLFLPGTITPGHRLVLTLGLSIATTVIAGLVAQLVVGVDRTVFALLLCGVAIGASLIGLERRGPSALNRDRRPLRPPLPGALATAAFFAAAAVSAWSIALTTEGAHDQLAKERFTSLWLVPERPADPLASGTTTRIGVSNHEGEAAAYTLRVAQGGQLVRSWRLRLDRDDSWGATLPTAVLPSHSEPLVARLYRAGELYRGVHLRPRSAA
jgi:uncharacterized protein DUF1616